MPTVPPPPPPQTPPPHIWQELPKFQRRGFSIHDDPVVGLTICYTGDVDGGSAAAAKKGDKKEKKEKKEKMEGEVREKKIPLASIISLSVVSELRYEFRLDSTCRQRPFTFRAETKAEFTKWVEGLQTLMATL